MAQTSQGPAVPSRLEMPSLPTQPVSADHVFAVTPGIASRTRNFRSMREHASATVGHRLFLRQQQLAHARRFAIAHRPSGSEQCRAGGDRPVFEPTTGHRTVDDLVGAGKFPRFVGQTGSALPNANAWRTIRMREVARQGVDQRCLRWTDAYISCRHRAGIHDKSENFPCNRSQCLGVNAKISDRPGMRCASDCRRPSRASCASIQKLPHVP
ncbi:hypothetical protein GGR61_003901 [Xanthomonas arboricola]|nr:hypothetical protein [Xanthomonas sp. 3058]